MSDKTKFKVVRGYEEAIQAIPYTDGQVYFALDSGRIYLDARGEEKIPVGGGNGVVMTMVGKRHRARGDVVGLD